jgi:hypothetical protein
MRDPQEPVPRELPPPAEPQRRGWSYTYRGGRGGRGGLWFPIALVVFGVVALLDQFGLLWWVRWELLWPLIVIAIGVALIIRRWR